jgi:hypothetical protein
LVAAYKVWHSFLPRVPKDARYTLGVKIDGLLVETIDFIFTAAYLGSNQKLQYLPRAAAKLDLVKFFLQITWEIKAIDNKQYALISEQLDEIGKMLGGWIRQIQKQNSPA